MSHIIHSLLRIIIAMQRRDAHFGDAMLSLPAGHHSEAG